MPNRPGNESSNDGGADRERQRDVSNEFGRGGQSGATATTGRRSNRGFASMDREKQREIASKGGRAAHAKGTAHEFDSDEARDAGRKGGQAVSRNREHMAMIGRRGGEARGHSRARSTAQANTQGTTGTAEGSAQNTRNVLSDREVDLQGAGAGQANGVSANVQGTRGGTNSSLGGEPRTTVTGAAERNTNH
jgi:general stress protein YciG